VKGGRIGGGRGCGRDIGPDPSGIPLGMEGMRFGRPGRESSVYVAVHDGVLLATSARYVGCERG
jgi:hypothetical protein